jgi:uncharacterized membrane protein
LRAAGVTRDQLRAMARRFGTVSWAAFVVLVASGIARVSDLGISWTEGTLEVKLALVVATFVVALVHQITARRTTPAVRGVVQGLVLGLSVAIFGVAVAM